MPLNISKKEIIGRTREVLRDNGAARYSDSELETYLLIALNNLRIIPTDNPEWTFSPVAAGAVIDSIVRRAALKKEIPTQNILNDAAKDLATACNNADQAAKIYRSMGLEAYRRRDRFKWKEHHAAARAWEINRDEFSRIYSAILPHITHDDIPF